MLGPKARTVPQLADANESSHVFVKDLEPPAVFFWLSWVPESTRTVEYFLERLKVDYLAISILSTPNPRNLALCRTLSARISRTVATNALFQLVNFG